MPTNISPSLCLNSKYSDLTLDANKYQTGSIPCIHYENFKLSIISTIACKITLYFHHADDKTSYNLNAYTLTANNFFFYNDFIKGERVYLEVDTLGNSFSSTDTIKINTHFTQSTSHLITI